MKKVLAFISIICMIGICSCTQHKQAPKSNVTELVVENTISADRQAMFLSHGGNYKWYETGVLLNNWLDEENDGSFEMVVNVFQVIEMRDSSSFDTFVYKYQHTLKGTTEGATHGFWVEDYPLNEEQIKVTFADAFAKVMQVNLPKPHTRQVVLRKQIGPVSSNPQWIFGNQQSQIYVDAVTGEVNDTNPAFKGFI